MKRELEEHLKKAVQNHFEDNPYQDIHLNNCQIYSFDDGQYVATPDSSGYPTWKFDTFEEILQFDFDLELIKLQKSLENLQLLNCDWAKHGPVIADEQKVIICFNTPGEYYSCKHVGNASRAEKFQNREYIKYVQFFIGDQFFDDEDDAFRYYEDLLLVKLDIDKEKQRWVEAIEVSGNKYKLEIK